jgi:long-chain acyl-CoA synthetase
MVNVTTMFDARSVPGAKPALVCPSRGESYSYDRIREMMNRLGNGLLSIGIRKGDRICIYLDSSPAYLVSYFAIWRIGAVAVPTNIVYRGDELLHAISDAGAVAIITDRSGAAVVESVRPRAPSLSHVICTDGPVPRDRAMGNHARGKPGTESCTLRL